MDLRLNSVYSPCGSCGAADETRNDRVRHWHSTIECNRRAALDCPNVLGDDQDIDLFKETFEPLLELLEKFLCLAVGTRDDFNLNDILDKIGTTVVPRPLIGSRLRADRASTENMH